MRRLTSLIGSRCPVTIVNCHTKVREKTVKDSKDSGGSDLKEEEETSNIKLVGNSQLPFASGVGIVETRTQFDGHAITTVYPKMLFRKRRLQLPNVKVEGLSFIKQHYRSMPKDFSKRLRPVTDECIRGGEYYFEDGLRKVRPYFIVMDMLVNYRESEPPLTLLQSLENMFPFHHPDWVRYKIERGHVQVNMERVEGDRLLVAGDYVSNLVHMHEQPTLDWPVRVIHEDAEKLVVDKPPSFVLHPVASFRMNSLLFLLKAEMGHDDLRVLHRLDKLTSGVCVLAKGPKAASRLKSLFDESARPEKEYLAMVDGEFPSGEMVCDFPLESHMVHSLEGEKFYSSPKECLTIFERLEFDGRASLVRCLLKTGRTHQIRLHLKMLGFHIINDDLYNPLDKKALMENAEVSVYEAALERMKARDISSVPSSVTAANRSKEDWLSLMTLSLGKANDCLTCEVGSDYFKKAFDFRSRMFMCLHAWKYRLGGQDFRAEMPRWITDKSILEQVYRRRKEEEEAK